MCTIQTIQYNTKQYNTIQNKIMGNFFTTQSQYPEVLDKEGIKQIMTLLGDVRGPDLENNPNPISSNFFNTECALGNHLGEISVKDPEFLNTTLKFISDYINNNFTQTKKFPPQNEDMTFKCGHLYTIKNTNYDSYQVQEYLNRDIGGIENIKNIHRGFCVYEFKNDCLKAISRTCLAPLDKVYVGIKNKEFMTYAPDVDMEITNCLKISWWVYELNDGTIISLPGTGGGVSLNEKGTINIMDVSGLRDIVNWTNQGLPESIQKFNIWKTKIEESGNCWCLCDGEKEGDLVLLKDFLNKVQFKEDVDDNSEDVDDNSEDVDDNSEDVDDNSEDLDCIIEDGNREDVDDNSEELDCIIEDGNSEDGNSEEVTIPIITGSSYIDTQPNIDLELTNVRPERQ